MYGEVRAAGVRSAHAEKVGKKTSNIQAKMYTFPPQLWLGHIHELRYDENNETTSKRRWVRRRWRNEPMTQFPVFADNLVISAYASILGGCGPAVSGYPPVNKTQQAIYTLQSCLYIPLEYICRVGSYLSRRKRLNGEHVEGNKFKYRIGKLRRNRSVKETAHS